MISIGWGTIFPFAWMLIIFFRSDADFKIEEIFAGLATMSIFFETTSMLALKRKYFLIF